MNAINRKFDLAFFAGKFSDKLIVKRRVVKLSEIKSIFVTVQNRFLQRTSIRDPIKRFEATTRNEFVSTFAAATAKLILAVVANQPAGHIKAAVRTNDLRLWLNDHPKPHRRLVSIRLSHSCSMEVLSDRGF